MQAINFPPSGTSRPLERYSSLNERDRNPQTSRPPEFWIQPTSMYDPEDEVVANEISYEQPGTLRLGCDSVTPWTWKEQANYNTQRDIDRTKAQQTQCTQVAELMARQQQVYAVPQGDQQPQVPQFSPPGQDLNWLWDPAGHYYQQFFDNNAQQWYTVWWDYNEGRAYRTLKDEYGQ